MPSLSTYEKEIQLLTAIDDLAEAKIWPKGEKESASALKVKHLFTLVYTRYISLIVDTKMYSWE